MHALPLDAAMSPVAGRAVVGQAARLQPLTKRLSVACHNSSTSAANGQRRSASPGVPAAAAAEAQDAAPLISATEGTKLLRRGARQKGAVTVDLSKSQQEGAQPLVGILDRKFRLSPEEVAALQAQHGLSEDELLARLIQPASELARPPISSFPVG